MWRNLAYMCAAWSLAMDIVAVITGSWWAVFQAVVAGFAVGSCFWMKDRRLREDRRRLDQWAKDMEGVKKAYKDMFGKEYPGD